MAPPVLEDKDNQLLIQPTKTNSNGSDSDTDEGFNSPSVQRSAAGVKYEGASNLPRQEGPSPDDEEPQQSHKNNSVVGNSNNKTPRTHTHSNSSTEGASKESDSQDSGYSQEHSDMEVEEETKTTAVNKAAATTTVTAGAQSHIVPKDTTTTAGGAEGGKVLPLSKDAVERKAETLSEFIVFTLIGKRTDRTEDNVEKTLLRCVRMMMTKHEILLKGMMKRLEITRETGYVSFVAVANELFEGEKMVVTWARIIALYAFGGQLALYCKTTDMEDFCARIAEFMGKYSREVVSPFVKKNGGWNKLCEEFPADNDMENKAWRYLTWTAVGLGLAATASFFTSH